MAFDETMSKQLEENFALLCNVIQQHKTPETKVNLTALDKIINQDIPNTLKGNAPPTYYELYTDFRAEYDKFRNFILYDRLIGKNIVALGGGFSSGKSSFLNALNDEPALPADIDPTTSVPTYIVHGENYDVQGINIFDTKIQLCTDDMSKIAHGFGEILDDDDGIVVESAMLGHVLESIFLSTPMQTYHNIAFLDTPGYSKLDSQEYSIKTDADIARRQLSTSNFILWFVQADAGTITEEDIEFIKSLSEDIPKLIILNKADKKPEQELATIIEKIQSTLDLKGVCHEGVYTFSSVDPEEYESDKIRAHLEGWNNQQYQVRFAHNFKTLFLHCRKFYENKLQEEGRRREQLNRVLTSPELDSDQLEILDVLVRELKQSTDQLGDILIKVNTLQHTFFQELKNVGDVVGIPLPEPTEIDLLTDEVQDPLTILAKYKENKGIESNPALQDVLQKTLYGIKPTLQNAPGGGEYKNQLADIIQKHCTMSQERIAMQDVVKSLMKLNDSSDRFNNRA